MNSENNPTSVLKILIACEESQTVTKAFRELGHEAFSCDIQECSGGHPEWHIKGDVIPQLSKGWDLMIGHPPCTYLSYVANRWYRPEYNLQGNIFEGFVHREEKRKDAFKFFMELINAPIEHIALENPVGIISKWYRKYDQIIHPYYFGDPYKKRTCLWLKNLPLLEFTNILPEPKPLLELRSGKKLQWTESLGRNPDRSKIRSKTFPGIACAMAAQWSEYVIRCRQSNL